MTPDEYVDLRSDTVTRPTAAMRAAMVEAPVGDDVFGEDPTVRTLEERVAGLLGKESALFTPTGSLANVLAVRSLVGPGEEVLCHALAHIARAELGAHGAVSGLTMRTWTGAPLDLAAIREMIAPDLSPYFVATRAISVENTHNFAGGAVLPIADLQALRALADETSVGVHLDGARLWNAHVATGVALETYGAIADVVTVCLSKGLGAPVGSLLVGSTETVSEARVWRKRLGAGMRQVGMLAAAGLYALDHHLDRLAQDHDRARVLAEAIGVEPAAVDTNIVVVPHPDPQSVVRVVTHLDLSEDGMAHAVKVLPGLF